MSDNELDDLFKEAAEGFTPPQDSSAWQKMSAMLDQSARPNAFWNWKTISATVVTGIATVAITWYAVTHDSQSGTATRNNQTIEKHEGNNATQGVVQEQKEQTNPTDKENFEAAKPVENQRAGKGAVTLAADHDKTKISNKKAVVHENKQSQELIERKQQQKREVKTEAVSEYKAEFSRSSTEASTGQHTVSSPVIPEEPGSVVATREMHSKTTSLQEIAKDSLNPEHEDKEMDSLECVVNSGKEEKKTKSKAGAGFNIKAVVSPDFSSVKFFTASKPGVNYGFLAGYSLNTRWSVYTGALYSKKLYVTDKVEGSYTWDDHDYPVKELDGDCRIIDIPINVYYTFFPQRSFSVSLGLGVSSYIMRKEDYVYCVDNYGTDVYYEQKIRGRNTEWFKILNVSAVVSKQLTGRLSAEFEPFVKAPLAGVGEGKVSLVSMGAFINLKYNLSLNK